MVKAGLGFAFMPEYTITHPGAVPRPLTKPAVEQQLALATMPGRPHSPAVGHFVRAAKTHRWVD